MSRLQKWMVKGSMPGRPGGMAQRGRDSLQDIELPPWTNYFDRRENVPVPGCTDVFNVYRKGDSGPVFVCLHGAGHSALTWAPMAKALRAKMECQIVAPDLRGHGSTQTANENALDIDTLCRDVGFVVHGLYGDVPPPIVLVGHSMGGAVAIHAAHDGYVPVVGLVVIDVVEGSALESLRHMQGVVRRRPAYFESVAQAISWSMASGGGSTSFESACVSMPGQLKLLTNEEVRALAARGAVHGTSETLVEEEEQGEKSETRAETEKETEKETQRETERETEVTPRDREGGDDVHPFYGWRVDLHATEPYWTGWFQGLSRMFLDTNAFKLLILADIDRLDTEMTIAQMQGKYQLKVLSVVGHCVQEDDCESVAIILKDFAGRIGLLPK